MTFIRISCRFRAFVFLLLFCPSGSMGEAHHTTRMPTRGEQETCEAFAKRLGRLDTAEIREERRSGRYEESRFNESSIFSRVLAGLDRKGSDCFNAVAIQYASQNSLLPAQYRPLIELLIQQNRLRPLGHSDRSALGGKWTERSPDGSNYLIMGAYTCESGSVFFDPHQSRSDLEASLAHEIDHLLKDKFFEGTGLAAEVVADEAHAAIRAGYLQLRRQFFDSGDKLDRVYLEPLRPMYIKGGPLDSLFRDFAESGMRVVRTSNDHFGGFGDDLFDSFISWIRQGFPNSRYPAENLQRLEQILLRTNKVYFPDVDLGAEKLVQTYLQRSHSSTGKINETQIRRLLRLMADKSSPDHKGVDAQILAFRARLTERSQACLRFRDAVKDGHLTNYIGVALPVPVNTHRHYPKG